MINSAIEVIREDISRGRKIIVSGCLAGIPCRYDGRSKGVKFVQELVESGAAVAICPEQLGGLPTPRPPAGLKIVDGIDGLSESEKMSDVSDACRDDAGDISKTISNDVASLVWAGRAKVVNRDGRDVTAEYKFGAKRAYEIARQVGARCAILKQHSPSCGCGSAGGAEPWQRIASDGVSSSYLKSKGLLICSEEEFI